MDKVVLGQKLESLRRCLLRIEQKRPDSATALAADADLQDILVLNLTRAVQLSVDIASHLISHLNVPSPATMGGSFTALETLGVIDGATATALRKAVGFRNIAVHNYEAINWDIVLKICHSQLADFRRFAQQVITHAGL